MLKSAISYIEGDIAVTQLVVGPYVPAALKIAFRANDLHLGRVVEQQLATRFVLPEMPDRPKLLFLSLGLCDILCTLSIIEHGQITPEYRSECSRAALAYLLTYLPEDLPRLKSVEGSV